MNKDQAIIQEEWNKYFYYGIEPKQVRPIIKESWIRCKNYGLCPWDNPYDKVVGSINLLNDMRKKNKWLLDYSLPVMNYAAASIDSISLRVRDANALTLYPVDSLDSRFCYDSSGIKTDEKNLGTCASALALHHNSYVEVMGFEHFFVRYQHNFRAAIPIYDALNNIVGVIRHYALWILQCIL